MGWKYPVVVGAGLGQGGKARMGPSDHLPPTPAYGPLYIFGGRGRMFHWRASSNLEILLCGGGSWLTWDFQFSWLEMRVWQWALLFSDNNVCTSMQVWNPNVFPLHWVGAFLVVSCFVAETLWSSPLSVTDSTPSCHVCHIFLIFSSAVTVLLLCSPGVSTQLNFLIISFLASWGFDTVKFSHQFLFSFCVTQS